VPSLHVTGPLLLPEDAGEPADDELAAGAAGAAVDAALPVEAAPAEADLLMPPCPLQAPRPPCGEVVPSLQTTGVEVLCASEGTGAASIRPASAAPPITPISLVRVICSFSLRVPLIIPLVRILQSLRRRYGAPCAGNAGRRPNVVRLQLKLDEDYP